MKARSALLVVFLVGLNLGVATPQARATFHLMKVREVFAGSLLEANADFVELQMYQFAQTQVSAHKLRLYDAAGAATECTVPANVANGNNQATILFATTQAQAAFGTADFTIPPLLSGGGGAACWENIDCVSWGSFSGATTSPAGTPEASIPVGQSIDRRTDISPPPNSLEATDDTDDSANDFEPENESATANGLVDLGSATCAPVGGDTTEPSSKIKHPKHKSTVTPKDARKLSGTADDQGGAGVSKVEIALRQKRKGGDCWWWHGGAEGWKRGSCNERFHLDTNGDREWSYRLSKELKPTGDKIKNYTLYSRATDVAGNAETEFVAGRNVSRFRTRGRHSAATVRG